jgi:hypothetical protein
MPHIEPYSDSEIDIATDQAMTTLLWAAGDMFDEAGMPTGQTWYSAYDVDDFAAENVAQMRKFLACFMEANLMDLVATGHVAGIENNIGRIGQIGHDYVLTTGGHGAGFWDRGLGEAGERLSEVCRAERQEWSLYEAADGTLHCESLEGYGDGIGPGDQVQIMERGEWVGPFTVTAQEGRTPDHLVLRGPRGAFEHYNDAPFNMRRAV